eukprot:2964680-Pleurochrysis_carterae.AAC.1
MMRSYPDVDEYPGVEDRLPAEKWSRDRVFHDMKHRSFDDKKMESKHRAPWEALKAWHTAYNTSDSITVG